MPNHPFRSLTIVLMGILLAAAAGWAQAAPKYAAINLQRTLEESGKGKAILGQLRAKEQSLLGELEKSDKQIAALEMRIKTQSLTMTVDALQRLEAELSTSRTQRKRAEEDAGKEFQRFQFSLVSKMQEEVFSLISDYAKEKEIAMVFNLSAQNSVVYCQPAIDITAEIIKRYDAVQGAKN